MHGRVVTTKIILFGQIGFQIIFDTFWVFYSNEKYE